MATRHFGHVSGVPSGRVFADRQALSDARVHGPTMAGIWGTPDDGASSIVLSGGYEDDIDQGDVIVYTGHGGNDPTTRRQIADQELTKGNLALAKSGVDGLPVRVPRGSRLESPYAPASGYRYDGLYRVESYWSETGRSGFRIWRYRLIRETHDAEPSPNQETDRDALPGATGPASRAETMVQRIIRNTRVAQYVKELHDHHCQVCGSRLETPAGPYSEGAHILSGGRTSAVLRQHARRCGEDR